jgi:hypothetical protein
VVLEGEIENFVTWKIAKVSITYFEASLVTYSQRRSARCGTPLDQTSQSDVKHLILFQYRHGKTKKVQKIY